jgi:hypothetical protein
MAFAEIVFPVILLSPRHIHVVNNTSLKILPIDGAYLRVVARKE